MESAPTSKTGRLTYGAFIARQRRDLGLNQEALADLCSEDLGIHQSRISQWERGATTPNHAQADALHAALGLSGPPEVQARRLLVEADRLLTRRRSESRSGEAA